MKPYRGETYYSEAPLKPAPWDWTVSGYIYLAGVGGGAQLLAALAQATDRTLFRGAIRNARHLSTAASAVGAALLVADLRTPRRWYNMLRILRTTSPMSIGTYVLGAFGGFSALTSVGELLRGRGRWGRIAGRIADLVQVPAAITGAGAGTYTASLLSSTSTPLWAATPRRLGVKFAMATVASAAAALSLGERFAGRSESSRRFDDIAALATLGHLGTSLLTEQGRARKGLPEDVTDEPSGSLMKTGDLVVAGAVPLVAYMLNRATGGRSPALSVAGSLAILAGGYMMRHGILHAGRATSRRPDAYFAFAQPEHLPGRRDDDGAGGS